MDCLPLQYFFASAHKTFSVSFKPPWPDLIWSSRWKLQFFGEGLIFLHKSAIVAVHIWSSDVNIFFSGEISHLFYICVPNLILCSLYAGSQELICLLVMIGALFFIFRFWSLTVLLLCWRMRIHNSEPWHRCRNTKADERRLASTLDLSCVSNVDLHICTQKHTCTC